jgi:hypothetical protein
VSIDWIALSGVCSRPENKAQESHFIVSLEKPTLKFATPAAEIDPIQRLINALEED